MLPCQLQSSQHDSPSVVEGDANDLRRHGVLRSHGRRGRKRPALEVTLAPRSCFHWTKLRILEEVAAGFAATGAGWRGYLGCGRWSGNSLGAPNDDRVGVGLIRCEQPEWNSHDYFNRRRRRLND